MTLVNFNQAKLNLKVGNLEMTHYSLCSKSDLMSLLEIRNLLGVREYMASSSSICEKSHVKWITERMHLNDLNAYYLVKVNGVVDGSVGFWLDYWQTERIGNWSLYRDVRKKSLTLSGAYEFCALNLFFAYLSTNMHLISYTLNDNPIRKIHKLAGFLTVASDQESMVQICSETSFIHSKIYKRYHESVNNNCRR